MNPQSFEQLNREIDAFAPVKTLCEGSAYPWIHYPERIVDGITRVPGIACGCGKIFEAHSCEAPSNQPAPELWASFQKFKAHMEELSKNLPSAASRKFECDRERDAVNDRY